MKKVISKNEAKERIDLFFAKDNFSVSEMIKMKRLAMKYKIKLGAYRKKFCKKCLSRLRGKTRVSNKYKTVECSGCGYKNRWKIS